MSGRSWKYPVIEMARGRSAVHAPKRCRGEHTM